MSDHRKSTSRPASTPRQAVTPPTESSVAERRPQALAAWMRGHDTGASSLALASVIAERMMRHPHTPSRATKPATIVHDEATNAAIMGPSWKPVRLDVPSDADDFGRCHRLTQALEMTPSEIREVTSTMGPRWKAIGDSWDILTDDVDHNPRAVTAALRAIERTVTPPAPHKSLSEIMRQTMALKARRKQRLGDILKAHEKDGMTGVMYIMNRNYNGRDAILIANGRVEKAVHASLHDGATTHGFLALMRMSYDVQTDNDCFVVSDIKVSPESARGSFARAYGVAPDMDFTSTPKTPTACDAVVTMDAMNEESMAKHGSVGYPSALPSHR